MIAAVTALTAAAGCGSDGGGNTGGAGGSSSSSTTSSSSTGTGGSGTSSSTGTGGSGGGVTCLDGATFADLFTIADASFCAVALYEADEDVGFQAPTWGTHGGPLWFVPDASGGGVTLERWSVPAGSTGKLTKQTTHVGTQIPDGAYAGGQAIDLPFFGWTAISWTGAFPDTVGEVIMIEGSAVDRTYAVNGAYSVAGVGDATAGRLLYTALSPIGAPTTDVNGFYAADACDMPKPDLGAGTGCQAPAEIAAWGDSSGPVAVDKDGNAFVVLASFGTGDQEARGFAAGEVARGAKATAGASLFTLPAFGSSLAAITPKNGKPGSLVFQPFDMNATPLDVIAQAYTVSSSVAAQGTPAKLLSMPANGAVSLALMTDDADRLWVAASGDKKTTFVVLDRKTP
ncbi:MAG: hypothetical protein QM820_60500 [Minicystis sp.]